MNKLEKHEKKGYEAYDDFVFQLEKSFGQKFVISNPNTFTARLIGALSTRKDKSQMIAEMMREFAGNFIDNLFVDFDDGCIYQRVDSNIPY
jgi:hypothetical protein